jgi:hypothetical protein
MESLKIDSIERDHILNHPVWKFWYEDNYGMVVPAEIHEISEDLEDSYIVLTEFTTSNGLSWIGFCSPQDRSGIDYIQPIILNDRGQVQFWKDADWTEQEKETELEKLGYNSNKVFPIIYRTKVKCDNEYFVSEILSFEP